MRYDQKRISVFTYCIYYDCQILMTLQCPKQIFEECSNIEFHENPSSGEGGGGLSCSMRTDGRTDGQADRTDEANSGFSQFCEST